MKWKKIGKTVNTEGTTLTYAAEGTRYMLLIQSRLRHIPHANGVGTWDHTTYHIIIRGQEAPKTYQRMTDAKEEAEKYWQEVYK